MNISPDDLTGPKAKPTQLPLAEPTPFEVSRHSTDIHGSRIAFLCGAIEQVYHPSREGERYKSSICRRLHLSCNDQFPGCDKLIGSYPAEIDSAGQGRSIEDDLMPARLKSCV